MSDEAFRQREERGESSSRGLREEERDHDLTRLDEREARERMRAAQEKFVQLGFAVYLIAVQRRRGVDYTLELHEDGAAAVDLREIQEVADEFGLDLHYSGKVIMADPRARPNWSLTE